MSRPLTTGLTLLGVALLALAGCSKSSSSGAPSKGAPGTRTASLASPDVYLQAQAFDIAANTFGNPDPIHMWGFGLCTAGFASCDPPTVPGPALTAAEGTSLTVHVRNALAGPFVEPVSLVVPGQLATMTPVFFDPATGAVTGTGARPAGDYHSRVRSFTAETPPDGATEQVYTWPNLKAGTFLYESGTHPAVQVQMGLYGALVVTPATAGQAYDDASSAYDASQTLVYSEIDPVLHQAIANGSYGPNPNAPAPAPAGWLTSTIGYRPSYFLINGKAFTPGAAPLAGGTVGQRLLLRLLNAGLQSKVPTIASGSWAQIAEDGSFLSATPSAGTSIPAPRNGYSVMLAAGKTADVVYVPGATGQVALFDRRGSLSNAGTAPGGMLVQLDVAAAASALKSGGASSSQRASR